MTGTRTAEPWARIPFLVRGAPQLVTLAYVLSAIAISVEAIRLLGGSGPTLAIIGLAVLVAGAAASWRMPAIGLAAVGAGAVLVGAAGWEPTVEFSVGAFVSFAVAARHPVTWRLPVVIASALYVAEALGAHLPVTPVAFVAGFAAAAAAATGISLRVQRQYWATLASSASDAVATRELEAQRRVAEERIRIARDLHDAMGHQVAVAAMHLGVAEVHLPTGADRSRAALADVRDALQTVLAETQQILGVLRNEGGQNPALQPVPGLDGLDDLLASYEALGLRIDARTSPLPAELDPLVSMTAYRVIQEALTNAHRYGGGTATVEVEADRDALRLAVRNARSAGSVSAGGGYGLVGMRERVEAIDGRLVIEDEPTGFGISADLPMGRRRTT